MTDIPDELVTLKPMLGKGLTDYSVSNGVQYPLADYYLYINRYKELINNIPVGLQEARPLNFSRQRFITGCGLVTTPSKKAQELADRFVCDLYLKATSGANPWKYISKNESKYAGKKAHPYTATMAALKSLQDEGLIEVIDGFRDDREGGRRFNTRLRARQRLIFRVQDRIKSSGVSVHRATEVDIHPDDSPVLDKIIVCKEEPAIGSRLHKALRTRRANQKLINQTNLNQTIFIGSSVHTDTDTTRIVMHRVFNSEDLRDGGRFYGPFWQSLPKEERADIRINGHKVVELDYGSMHIRLLYDRVGVPMPDGEAYKVGCYPREVGKSMLLIILNAASRNSAIKAFIEEHPDSGYNYDQLNDLINKLCVLHEPIKDYLYSGYGIKLQGEDADIAERIMLNFIQRTSGRTAILCVHESFIVAKRYADDLKEIMLEELENAIVKIAHKPTHTESKTPLQLEQAMKDGSLFATTDSWIKHIENLSTEYNGKYSKKELIEFEYGSFRD